MSACSYSEHIPTKRLQYTAPHYNYSSSLFITEFYTQFFIMHYLVSMERVIHCARARLNLLTWESIRYTGPQGTPYWLFHSIRPRCEQTLVASRLLVVLYLSRPRDHSQTLERKYRSPFLKKLVGPRRLVHGCCATWHVRHGRSSPATACHVLRRDQSCRRRRRVAGVA